MRHLQEEESHHQWSSNHRFYRTDMHLSMTTFTADSFSIFPRLTLSPHSYCVTRFKRDFSVLSSRCHELYHIFLSTWSHAQKMMNKSPDTGVMEISSRCNEKTYLSFFFKFSSCSWESCWLIQRLSAVIYIFYIYIYI